MMEITYNQFLAISLSPALVAILIWLAAIFIKKMRDNGDFFLLAIPSILAAIILSINYIIVMYKVIEYNLFH